MACGWHRRSGATWSRASPRRRVARRDRVAARQKIPERRAGSWSAKRVSAAQNPSVVAGGGSICPSRPAMMMSSPSGIGRLTVSAPSIPRSLPRSAANAAASLVPDTGGMTRNEISPPLRRVIAPISGNATGPRSARCRSHSRATASVNVTASRGASGICCSTRSARLSWLIDRAPKPEPFHSPLGSQVLRIAEESGTESTTERVLPTAPVAGGNAKCRRASETRTRSEGCCRHVVPSLIRLREAWYLQRTQPVRCVATRPRLGQKDRSCPTISRSNGTHR